MGTAPHMVWHRETTLPKTDLIVLPGGFSYGDYLRCGAMAANSPIMRAVIAAAKAGTPVLGICNGFQILIEAGLLPGALMRNRDLKFICKDVHLRVETTDSIFTSRFNTGEIIKIPVAHHDGNYFADAETVKRLKGEGQIVLRYCDGNGDTSDAANINGSVSNIAGIVDEERRIFGLMPHPERVIEPLHSGTHGAMIFDSLMEALA
jgi:phosphoribosylformylglycinamidine synthase|tara:strand:- start:17969 stop:18586 length:618 start_codon:yes stop_codon:yes gene_type:complete